METANAAVVSHLNAKVKEPEVLEFYEGATHQFTHNASGRFNATQLCMLWKVPSTSEVESFSDVTVLVAPPGAKSIDVTNKPTEQTPGWKIQKVGLAPETTLNLWKHGVKAKRKQCGLWHHMASTIHSAIGHTVTKMATQLGVNQDLWEKAMVVALVSRVLKARDLIFVGDKQENTNAILRGLCNETQCDDCMNHIVQILSQKEHTHESSPVNLAINPFRPKDIPIPSDISGVACCLVSVKSPPSVCVGVTQDLSQRLRQHNSGIGSKSSSDPMKRPWGLLAYVAGFNYDCRIVHQFELRWQHLVAHAKPKSAQAAASLANTAIDKCYCGDGLQLALAD